MITLNDACLLIEDCLHSTAPIVDTGYPLIRTPDIGKGRLNLDNAYRVTEKVYLERVSRAIPQKNDLILAREAPAGNVAIINSDTKVCLGQRTVLLRPNPEVADPSFLCYFLLAPKQQYNLLGTANGATVPHVNMATIRTLRIELPALKTQRRIAGILSAYDDLIENNQKQIKLLEEAAMRLYKEWFVKLRFPGYETTKIVNGMPDGWSESILDTVIEFDPKVPLVKGEKKKYVPMAALNINSMTLNESLFEETTTNSGSKFQNNDVLLARITPSLENGKTAFVYFLDNEEKAVGSTEFIVMRSRCLNPYMVYCIARSEWFRNAAIKSMTGATGRQRVQLDVIKVIEFLLPPDDIIFKFEQHTKPLFEQIKVLMKQITLLRQARDKLLPKLMSGEIEV